MNQSKRKEFSKKLNNVMSADNLDRLNPNSKGLDLVKLASWSNVSPIR